MADNRALLTNEAGAVPMGVLRLAGGSDVLELAGVEPWEAAPGEAAVEYASRRIDSNLNQETHNEDLNVVAGFTSILERFRHLRHTAIGRAAMITTMASTTIVGVAACGHNNSPNTAGRGAAPIAIADGGVGAGGPVQSTERHIFGDPTCYDGFGAQPEAKQLECATAFSKLSMDQVEQLAPLDQARWMIDYRVTLPGVEHDAPALVTWDKMLHSDQGASFMADTLLTDHNKNVILLSWLMQQSDNGLAADPRTWAALFGLGTTKDAQPMHDAATLAESGQGNGLSFDEYLHRGTTNQAQPFPSSAQNVALHGNTLTFTAARKDGSQGTFSYAFTDTGYYTSIGQTTFHDAPNDSDLYGKALVGMPVKNS